MAETLGDAPSESTLLRHFRTLEIPTGTPAQATGRFEASRPNEIWVGDGLHGPKIGGRKTYLFAFLDDHSRLVTAARWAFAEDAVRLSAALRPPFRPTESPTRPMSIMPRKTLSRGIGFRLVQVRIGENFAA